MRKESRKDLLRALTAALALVSVVLVYLHFTDRDREMREAREAVQRAHVRAVAAAEATVRDLRARLLAWERDGPPPAGFSKVILAGAEPPPGMRRVQGPPPQLGQGLPEPYWAATFNPETGSVLENETSVAGGEDPAVFLRFPTGGQGRFSLQATLAAPAPKGAAPVPVELLIRRGSQPPEALRVPALAAASAVEAARAEFGVPAGGRALSVSTPPGTRAVRVEARFRGQDAPPRVFVLDGRAAEIPLDPASGPGVLVLKATLAGTATGAGVPVEVAFLAEGKEPRPLEPGVFAAGPGVETARVEIPFTLDDSVRTTRHDVILRTPSGSPRVLVTWNARIGETEERTLVLAVLRTFPEREGVDEAWQGGQWQLARVRRRPERLFVIGYAPLGEIAAELQDAAGLETRWGDRLYLTDGSGTVAEALPDYPERIRHRRNLEGRTSLSSLATQRVKVRSGGTEEYEGFAKDRVVGAFGTLDALGGGLIVEREERRVLEAYRGIQAWHVAALLFGALLLWPLVPPVVRRIREDTELPRLLAYARDYVPFLAMIVAAAVVYSIGQGIFVYQGKVITDEVILSQDSSAYERLVGICWLLAGVAVCMFAVNWVKEYLGKVIQNRLVMEIRCALCDKLVHLPMAFHARQRSGDLLSRIGNDVAETNRGLEMLFGDVISDPILIVTLVASAFWINWRLALVIFVGLPVLILPISYFGAKIKKHARRRQAKKADVTHSISQMLAGIRVVKAFRMEEHESRRIRQVSETFLHEALKVARAQVTSKESLELFSNLSVAVILGLGGYLVLERQVSVGDLTAFAALIARMYRSSKNLTGNYNKMQEALAGTERIFEILDAPDTMADRPSARALVRPRTSIAFENVSFRYHEEGPWTLRQVSVEVPVGSSVALVGATGAGKSTMLDLVARFYDPQEGRVAVDGVDLRDYSRTSLMSHVAMVTQEAFLFNATIAENLRYGRPGATQDEIEAAARAAFIHEEILKQPEGYQTVVGERGTRLSGGQRQRITIARAILKDPPILILDEATSALDSKSEEMVQKALSNLMKDRTTFVIAHRLSTVQHVDRILVLDGGHLVEQGTHDELLEVPGGVYRHLYEIQFAVALRAPRRAPDPGAAAG